MAKRSSGATEVNGFIAVGNDKSGNVRKTNVRQVNQTKSTLNNKEDLKTKKPADNTEKDGNIKIISGEGKVRKLLAAQNDLEKKKAMVNKKTTESKPTNKRETQALSNKVPVRKDVQAKTNSIGSKNAVQNPAKNVSSSQVEQRKVTNIKATASKPPATKFESKKGVDVKQIPKNRLQVGKNPETKKTNKVPTTSSQRVKPNNADKTRGLIQKVKAGQPKTTKDSPREKDNTQLPEISRQGTWVKETSKEVEDDNKVGPNQDRLLSKERNAVNVEENYESDFEAETSVSERTEPVVKTYNSVKTKTQNGLIPINNSRSESMRKQEMENDAGTKLSADIRSNTTLDLKRQNLPNFIQTSEPSVSTENSMSTENKESNDEPDYNTDVKYSSFTKHGESLKQNDEQSLESNEQSYDNDNYDYEDDFEEYESDFEEDTESGLSVTSNEESGTFTENASSESTTENGNASSSKRFGTKITVEEERKLDSGNYDLTTKMVLSEAVKQRQLDEIREAISRENTIYQESNANKARPEILNDDSSKPKIMNFKEAYNRSEIKKNRVKAKLRASQLLGMVTLHVVHHTLFEITPIPYSVFIKCYGKLNSVQASTQTNEDILHEEVQTEEIISENKWTQHPIEFHRWENNGNDLDTYLEDRAGVGSDTHKNKTKCTSTRKYNANNLNNFMQYAGQIMLILLEEEEQITNLTFQETNKKKYKFSDGFIQISVENINFLKDRTISDVVFSPHNPNTILTVHRTAKDSGNTFIDQYYARSTICVWNVLEPSQPLKMLVAPCQISAACFDDTFLDLIYAGLTDGTICVWDLSESIDIHKQNMIVDMPTLRSPSYCTYDIKEEIHLSTVIALTSIGSGKTARKGKRATLMPGKLISLSEDGKIIVWIVIQLYEQPILSEKQALAELGVAYWGKVKLQFTALLDPISYLHITSDKCWAVQFICMVRSPVESPSVLLGSNLGKIVHIRTSGDAADPEPVYASTPQERTAVTCIEICPHDGQLFLAGYDDGTIKMFSIKKRAPLRVYACHQERNESLSKIKWSPIKPALFMALDKESSLFTYDLCYGDLKPMISIDLKKYKACHLDMSKDKIFSYVAFVKKKCSLEVHKLKSKFNYVDELTLKEEFKLFELYIKNMR